MNTFLNSSFGTVLMTLFQGVLSAPSWRPFISLACGWGLARDRHPITTSVWLTGATTITHVSRFSVFLGCPLYHTRGPLWGAVIRFAAQCVPEDEVSRVAFDDTTKKKAGTPIEGIDRSRNGAGAARQAYRTRRGLHVVVGIRRSPLKRWPGDSLSVPVGLERSLNPEHAQALNVPSRSRSQVARAILDCMAEPWPGRPIRRLADGGSATKDSLRQFPDAAQAGGFRSAPRSMSGRPCRRTRVVAPPAKTAT